MTGAMYSAISGLKSHMSKLNVIGNNIANTNTYGYKSARTVFSESIYNSVRNGSDGSESLGGVNPSQLGYGCSIGMIDLDMGTQSYVPTGRGLDTMISGDGFFFVGPKAEKIVSDDGSYSYADTDPKSLYLTRVGNFNIDAEGYLVDGNGYVVYGFVTCAGMEIDTETGKAIKDGESGPAHRDSPALSTQLVPIRLPLAAVEPEDPTDLTQPRGGSAIFPGVAEGRNVYDPSLANETTTGKPISVNVDSIKIDGKTGMIQATNNSDDEILVLGYIPLAQVTNINGVTHVQGPYFQALSGSGHVAVASLGDELGGQFLNNATGEGAEDVPIYGTGETFLITNGLEASGTDIATEFSEMITTQRGYQANTRIVTVTDSMLEELVNMKR